MTALEVDGAIQIDGLLDEPAWSLAGATTGTWIQITPEPGMPASELTTVRMLFDAEKLYIDAIMNDSELDRLVITGLEQDFDTTNSDMVAFAIDTYHDRQNGFVFVVNPEGAVFDAQVFDEGTLTPAWEGITDVRTSLNDSSWVVEMALTFSTLRFNPVDGGQVWGLNVTRRLRRKNEDSMWAPIPLQYRVYKFSMAGSLEGLRDLPRGRNLWAKPYVLGNRLNGATLPEASNDVDVGFDVKWGMTPRLTLDLTANTDFSQVEVDAERVNLTRFSLFFPEKRDFFLENGGHLRLSGHFDAELPDRELEQEFQALPLPPDRSLGDARAAPHRRRGATHRTVGRTARDRRLEHADAEHGRAIGRVVVRRRELCGGQSERPSARRVVDRRDVGEPAADRGRDQRLQPSVRRRRGHRPPSEHDGLRLCRPYQRGHSGG